MTPVRVARVLGRPNVGGPVRTVVHLCRRLVALGYETLLIVGESDEGEGDALRTMGVESGPGFTIHRVPSMRRALSLSDFRARGDVRRALAAFRPEIVHTHAAKAGALGRRVALGLDPRPVIVHTYHGHSLSGYFPPLVSRVFAGIERRLAARTDRLIAVSPAVRDELVRVHRVAPAARIEVIANGIDLTPFPAPTPERRAAAIARLSSLGASARPAQTSSTPDRALHLLVPARLVPIKDHDLLFDALERVGAAPGAPIVLHLLGDGSRRAELEARAKRLPTRVEARFHGFRDDLPALLPGADLVVLTSRNEGMSLALIEAMAAGVPVVATRVGGNPDLVRDDAAVERSATGWLVPPGDPESLARTLMAVLADPAARAARGAQARAIAVAEHSIERVVDAHARLYESLLAARHEAGSTTPTTPTSM